MKTDIAHKAMITMNVYHVVKKNIVMFDLTLICASSANDTPTSKNLTSNQGKIDAFNMFFLFLEKVA